MEELLTLANILKVVKTSKGFVAPQAPETSTQKITSDVKSRFLSSNVQESGASAQYFDKYCTKSEEIKETTKAKCSDLLDNIWIHMSSR